MLLSGDICLNLGPLHNHPQLDHDESKIFKLRALHLNINSLLPKTDELRRVVKLTNASVTGISKSKLEDSVLTSEIQINQYDLLSFDRSKRGGGKLVMI